MKKILIFASILILTACSKKKESSIATDEFAPIQLDSNDYWVERHNELILILPKKFQGDTINP